MFKKIERTAVMAKDEARNGEEQPMAIMPSTDTRQAMEIIGAIKAMGMSVTFARGVRDASGTLRLW
jgi:hypothetical protein